MNQDLLRRLWQEEDGQDLIEYALLAALISLVAVASVNALGDELREQFERVARHL